MKEVIAIVRINMMNQTKQALTDAGIDAFFAHEAHVRIPRNPASDSTGFRPVIPEESGQVVGA
jgi:hypothetical protein